MLAMTDGLTEPDTHSTSQYLNGRWPWHSEKLLAQTLVTLGAVWITMAVEFFPKMWTSYMLRSTSSANKESLMTPVWHKS